MRHQFVSWPVPETKITIWTEEVESPSIISVGSLRYTFLDTRQADSCFFASEGKWWLHFLPNLLLDSVCPGSQPVEQLSAETFGSEPLVLKNKTREIKSNSVDAGSAFTLSALIWTEKDRLRNSRRVFRWTLKQYSWKTVDEREKANRERWKEGSRSHLVAVCMRFDHSLYSPSFGVNSADHKWMISVSEIVLYIHQKSYEACKLLLSKMGQEIKQRDVGTTLKL